MPNSMSCTLSAAMYRDLAGYKLVNATVLLLDHNLMGTFPAIYSESGKPIIFLEDDFLRKVRQALPDRKSKTQTTLFLLEPGGKSGFFLQVANDGNARLGLRHFVLQKDEFDQHQVAIEWAPGLL